MIHVLTICGTRMSVSTLEKAVEAARMNRIGANVRIDSTKMSGISLTVIVRYRNRPTSSE